MWCWWYIRSEVTRRNRKWTGSGPEMDRNQWQIWRRWDNWPKYLIGRLTWFLRWPNRIILIKILRQIFQSISHYHCWKIDWSWPICSPGWRVQWISPKYFNSWTITRRLNSFMSRLKHDGHEPKQKFLIVDYFYIFEAD